MSNNGNNGTKSPRCIALVGPFQSGKTTLLEAILARSGAVPRQGSVDAGSTVGDGSKESRLHKMSTEVSVASTSFLNDSYTFIDCPGSVEFLHDMRAALPAVDAAVVVCEADERKLPQLSMVLREIEGLGVPHMLFLNKIDKADKRVQDTLAVLQPASRLPLLLRQIPIWREGIVVGYVDLALERAFVYREHSASQVVPLEGDDLSREREARFQMLETLADHDDALMEQLLEEIEPPRDRVFDDLAKELREGQVTPVLLGSALHGNGIQRLLKALRHEVCGLDDTLKRLGVAANGGDTVGYVQKTLHTSHGGKMSIVRVLAGQVADGTMLMGAKGEAARVAGVFKVQGQHIDKRGPATAGETVALGKLDPVITGDTVTSGKAPLAPLVGITPVPPVLAIAVAARDRKDDVKLGQALNKLLEEDPSLVLVHNAELSEIVLHGQGEMQLRVAIERLQERFQIQIATHPPRVGYRETIRKGVVQRGRHKKQSGGHGQFGDCVLDIQPLPRSSGFQFAEKITGGVVPRQYIPSIEEGVKDGLKEGPLGFPVVDVSVTLIDGSYHTVDSSDMAFRTAGRVGIHEALPNCQPVLLEPIHHVDVFCPSDATAKVNAILSGRRGQILGFEAREGWPGWDVVRAEMPEAEIGDLIVELRSATAGVGTFITRFDHMAELVGRAADQVIAAKKAAAA
ncbi:elongation factor G [Blastochloris sulfoviridis]|uniref:Elongation factor G n=1 Tax=Blastochloris sulfoviridis TaxID=50712 RepID=A0A5M6I2Z1_9HYPH|nr:elongation factor G [Blastochloris sulfoviridis]KAA5602570.1 elongation factor G [Blastochloris sulfoviridis]